MYSACNQMDGKAAEYKTIGEAVDGRIIANETLAYFIARIQMYMVKIGVDPKKLRFRQHMGNEMAHYACDCWDAECLTSYVCCLALKIFCFSTNFLFCVCRVGSNASAVLIVPPTISRSTPRPLVFLW